MGVEAVQELSAPMTGLGVVDAHRRQQIQGIEAKTVATSSASRVGAH